MQPATASVEVGSLVTVDVAIASAPTPVSLADLAVGFDTSMLTFVSASFGSALGDASGADVLTDVALTAPGYLSVFAMSLLGAPDLAPLQAASFPVVSLRFSGLQAGTTPVTLTVLDVGDENGPLAPVTVGDAQVTVTPPPTLTVIRTGLGSGTVTAPGIACGPSCSTAVTSGTTVTLTAAPASGSAFGSWSGCASVSGSACTVTVNANTTVTATFVPGPRPDLRVSAITLAGATVTPGTRLRVKVLIANHGAATAGTTTTRVYLSRDAVRSVDDTVLLSAVMAPVLAAGQSVTRTVTPIVTRTTAPGTYRVIACAYDAGGVGESDDTNNCTASAAITVTRPDLVIDAVTPQAASVRLGGLVRVLVTLRNVGTRSADPSTVRLYLATDRARGTDDRLVSGSRAVGSVTPGRSVTVAVAVTVPVITPGGSYFVVACADDLNRVNELDESNNCGASVAAIAVTTP